MGELRKGRRLMLRVTVELVPHGMEDCKRVIGTIEIGLKKVETGNVGNYVSRIKTDQNGPEPPHKTVKLKHWRDDGAMELVRRCLGKHLE